MGSHGRITPGRRWIRGLEVGKGEATAKLTSLPTCSVSPANLLTSHNRRSGCRVASTNAMNPICRQNVTTVIRPTFRRAQSAL